MLTTPVLMYLSVAFGVLATGWLFDAVRSWLDVAFIALLWPLALALLAYAKLKGTS